jgi:hypothetical protein
VLDSTVQECFESLWQRGLRTYQKNWGCKEGLVSSIFSTWAVCLFAITTIFQIGCCEDFRIKYEFKIISQYFAIQIAVINIKLGNKNKILTLTNYTFQKNIAKLSPSFIFAFPHPHPPTLPDKYQLGITKPS